jgi:hypothetical protein
LIPRLFLQEQGYLFIFLRKKIHTSYSNSFSCLNDFFFMILALVFLAWRAFFLNEAHLLNDIYCNGNSMLDTPCDLGIKSFGSVIKQGLIPNRVHTRNFSYFFRPHSDQEIVIGWLHQSALSSQIKGTK